MKKDEFKNMLGSIKIHSKNYFKTNILFTTFFVSSIINACLLRFFSVKNYFDISPLLADIAIILIIGAIGYFIKPKHQFKYYMTWTVIFTATCLINSVYYNNFLSFTSFSLLKTSLQLGGVTDAVFENVIELKDFVYLWSLFAMIYVNHMLKKKKYYQEVAKLEVGKVRALNTLVVGLIFMGFFVSTLNSTDISRLSKQWNREYLVMKFGIYSYQINDLFTTVKSQLNPLFGYDKNAKVFRDYYNERDNEQKTNEYTNIFKGKNVLFIHTESTQKFALDLSFNGQEVAPTLNRLAKEGLYFSNFYSQESVGTSSDSEFTLNTSLMPASSGTVFISYYDREYVSIPNLLKNMGYYTFSMHGNNGTFWNRVSAHKSLGYENYYYYTKDFTIDETIGLGLSDKSFLRQAVPKIVDISSKNQNFMGTLILLTNHTPFSDIEGHTEYEVNYKYQKLNEETGQQEEVISPYLEGTKMGNYLKSVHYEDEALEQFINDMDAAGLLEDTVLVFYGDHDAKLKPSEFDRLYNYDYETNSIKSKDDPTYKEIDYYDYEINRKVPLIIWSKNQKLQKEITTVMGMYDVLPTVGNMFGFSSPYALGHDVFSTKDNVVVFPDGNWLTDKMYYSQSKGEGKLLNPDDTVSIDYINKYNQISEDYIAVSNSIIVYDLIKKLNEVNNTK